MQEATSSTVATARGRDQAVHDSRHVASSTVIEAIPTDVGRRQLAIARQRRDTGGGCTEINLSHGQIMTVEDSKGLYKTELR